MGYSERQQQPEDVIQTAPDEDIEKNTVPAHEEKPPTAILPAIDPELERRVVRKLDWRVPTLLGFFCMLRTADIKRTYTLTMCVCGIQISSLSSIEVTSGSSAIPSLDLQVK
jgi:hypothetical protein